jgi:hypothetical protein
VNESIAGTIRMAILPVPAVGAGAASAAVDVGTGEGEDSARRRLPFCVVTTWTSKFMGVCPCRSRKVGVKGTGWLLPSFVLAGAGAVAAPHGPAPESPLLGLLPLVAGIYRRLKALRDCRKSRTQGQPAKRRARCAAGGVDSK